MRSYDTIPRWKMPDQEKIPHRYKVGIRLDFIYNPTVAGWGEFLGDLTKYYDWSKKYNIEMEHSIIRFGREIVENLLFQGSKVYKINPGIEKSKNCLVRFVFLNQDDAEKFERK